VRRNALAWALCCYGIALPWSVPSALGQCGAEAKLLVSPREVQKSVAALHAGKESRREVYLFDTEDLGLLSQGAILRLRTGAGADLTVKLRSGEGEKQKDPSEGKEAFKCEVDLVGNSALTSHSLRRAWKSKPVPETGEALHAALSAGQLKLLSAARISIDWHHVKRIAQVQATDWEVRTDGPLRKVTVELWDWSSGKILELSAKTDPKRGPSTMSQLREMAVASRLTVEEKQEPKTSLVLHAVAAAP